MTEFKKVAQNTYILPSAVVMVRHVSADRVDLYLAGGEKVGVERELAQQALPHQSALREEYEPTDKPRVRTRG